MIGLCGRYLEILETLERRADRLKKQLKGDASAAPELALVERLIARAGRREARRAP